MGLMGKIFKEARGVFGYETGVLASKIKAFEDLGLSKSFVSRIIVCSPRILVGDMNVEVGKALEILKTVGVGVEWVNENLSEEEDESYDWRSMHRFPEIEVKKCVLNLRHCFLFLKKIKMECDEIGKIFRSHSSWLGACSLKKPRTLLDRLSVGTRRLCQVIQENPEVMKKWTMGLKVQPLPPTGEEETSRLMKTQFLINLGYDQNSEEMERAVKKFRGRGSELQQRFDFLVSLGLNEKDVRNMVNAFPQILCQASDLLEAKVNYIVNELGYPFSIFVTFPSCLVFTLQRMKLRLGMIPFMEGKDPLSCGGLPIYMTEDGASDSNSGLCSPYPCNQPPQPPSSSGYSPSGNPPPPPSPSSPPQPPRSQCPPVPPTGCCNQPPQSTYYSPPYPYFYTPPYPYGTLGGGDQSGGGQGAGGGGTVAAVAYYASCSLPT
ncbi:hypothetical protein HID58_087894 [Brassica napus]|uniref:Uncharacterized protein n=1 Tax=Brassica napus TaxID=3708 RepID=A0ABQ7XX66_BRANA|nr:hypothetical protein HID58_087894 [Brassica napus]